MSRPTPPAYKTRNWPAYNEALKRHREADPATGIDQTAAAA